VKGIEYLPSSNFWPDEITMELKIKFLFKNKNKPKSEILNKSFRFAFIPNLSSIIPKVKIIKVNNKRLMFKKELGIKFKKIFK
tara:strand:+ start:835 stop:1083 length:249 start_codon:yes stop_codon:yes gene_type:complete